MLIKFYFIMNNNNMEKKEKFVEMRAKGLTYRQIADTLEVSMRTLFFWAKEFENEIKFLNSVERENYLVKLELDSSRQYKIISEELKKIEDALKLKEYQNQPIAQLFRWKFRLLDKLAKLPVQDEETVKLYGSTVFYHDAIRGADNEEAPK